MAGSFALANTNRLYEYLVEPCSLAKDNGLTRLSGNAAQRACCRTGTDERVWMYRELLHTCLVSENTALGALTAGVDGQDGQLTALLFQDMNAKLVDTG